MHFIALDLETTGLNPQKDKIIEIAAIKIDEQGNVLDVFQSLINPGIAIPGMIQNLTGIRNEWVEKAPFFDELKNDIIQFIDEHAIVGHSVQFDVDFLKANGIPIKNKILDTFELAQTLLSKEPSYSLEILSEKYNLTHDNKHRAYDDTLVVIALFKLLLEKLKTIPGAVAIDIKDILKKSSWGWKEIIEMHLNPDADSECLESDRVDKKNFMRNKPGTESIQNELIQQLRNTSSLILESDANLLEEALIASANHHEHSGEQSLIATSSVHHIKSDARIHILHHPSDYLCASRLKIVLGKSHFEKDETRLLIKILIWKHNDPSGEKHRISIGKEEHPTWQNLSALHHLWTDKCDGSECAYQKAFEAAKRSPVTIVSHRLLIENAVRKQNWVPPKKHLIMESVEAVEQESTNTLTQHFSLDRFQESLTELENKNDIHRIEILFGLIGIFTEKYGEKTNFQTQVILKNDHRYTSEWQQIQESVSNLIEELEKDESTTLKQYKNDLKNLKKSIDPNKQLITWLTLGNEGSPWIHSCPKQIGLLLKQLLWNQYPAILFLSQFGSLNGSFHFLKTRLHLDEQMPEKKIRTKPTSIPFYTYENLPNIYKDRNRTETLNIVTTIAKNHPDEDIFYMMNSQKAVEEFYPLLQKRFEHENRNLLAQNILGGIGKISERFEKTENTFLMGTEKLWSTVLQTQKIAHLKILIIHRIPFMPLSHPVNEYELAQFNNGFIEYNLPRAILRLKGFIHQFLQHGDAQEIHCLDPRIFDYDGKIIESLPESIKL